MCRENPGWGAPRIHGELLKLGITVSQATASRYTPPSRKYRRSQAWRTFIRNHAAAIVQTQKLNGHNWARDLLSHLQSRSRVFSYHVSAFVVAPATGSAYPIHGAGHRAARKANLLTMDRIRDPPTAQERKHHADRLSIRSTGKRVSFTRTTRRHRTNSPFPKLRSSHWIATLDNPKPASSSHIWNDVFRRSDVMRLTF
jgi:hypothetical protein